MRFFDYSGNQPRAPRKLTRQTSPRSATELNAEELARSVQEVSVRVESLESERPSQTCEYEIELTNGTEVVIQHGFGGPVRWYATDWSPFVTASTIPTAGFAAYRVPEKSDSNSLTLYPLATGKAVIRVESSSYGVA